MVRSIFFFAQWLIARRRTWLRILTWITRFGYWLFILYGLLEWFRPRPIAEQIKRRKTLVYCLFSVIPGSSVSWVIGKSGIAPGLSPAAMQRRSCRIRPTLPFPATIP